MSYPKQVFNVLLLATIALFLVLAVNARAEDENATINGTVRDADSSTPLENVTVSVGMNEGSFENSTKTDGTGYFELGVQDGNYRLFAQLNLSYYFYIDFDVSVGDGETQTENIDLEPHGGENSGFTGQVLDGGTNEPINDTAIMYMDIENGSGWFGTLNETGEFNHSLMPGTYYISVGYDGYREYQQFNYGLVDGQWDDLFIELLPENSTLSGYILDNETGDPIHNATVVISDGDPFFPTDYNNQTMTDENGFYTFNVSAGLYDVNVFGPRGYFANLMFGIPTMVVEQVWVPLYDDAWTNVSLNRTNFRGWLHDQNDDPLGFPPVLVMALNLEGGLFGGDDEDGGDGRNGEEEEEDDGPGGPIAIPTEDGYFEFFLTPGNWWIVALDFSLFEGENASYEANLSRQLIGKDHEMGYLNLTMWDMNSTLRGFITDPDGVPLENATVQLYSKYTVMFDDSKTVMTDATGYYEIPAGQGDYFAMIGYYPDSEGERGDPFEESVYEQAVIPVSLDYEEDENLNHQFSDAVVQNMYMNATFAMDWNSVSTTMELRMSANNSQYFRLWLDGLIGNGDYSLDESEVERFAELVAEDEDEEEDNDLSVDNITFSATGPETINLTAGLGAWDLADALVFSSNSTQIADSIVPFSFNHTVRFNVSYETASGDPVITISYAENFNFTGNSTSDYVTFSGTNPLTIDTAMDPDPEDDVDEEVAWFKVETDNNYPIPIIDSVVPNPASEGEMVNFQGHGDDIDGDVVAFRWLLNGVELSTEASFQKDDIKPGNHTLGFQVQDDDGDWSPIQEMILEIRYVNDKPVATIDSIEPDNPRTKATIYFNGTGTDTDGTIVEYLWAIDGWVASDQTSFSLSNLTGGSYDVEFKVRDDNNTWSNVATETLLILTNVKPEATITSVTPNPANVNTTVTFVGTGTDSDGSVVKYEWDLDGDGTYDFTSSTTGTTTHTYTTKGTFTVELKVTDNEGKTDTATLQVRVSENVAPTAEIIAITPKNALVGGTITFSGNGTDTDGTIAAYQWLLNDVETATTPSFSKNDLAKGTYIVKFRVQDDFGEWSEYVNDTINILEELKAIISLSKSNVAAGEIVTIDASGSTGNIVSWAYEFGDGTTRAASNQSKVTHAYTSDGSYTISVKVTDVLGATESSTVVIKVGDSGDDDDDDSPAPGLASLVFALMAVAALMSIRRRH